MDNNTSKLNIGICLCGGGARGIAHIGVLQALEENNIIPQYISGASMGAIVGAFYAEGLSPKEILDILSKPRFYKAFSFGIPIEGLTDLSYLKRLLKNNIKDDSFENLQKKLFVCISNLNTGAYEIFNSGKLSTIVLASAAIPLIFKPVRINESLYVDGGLLNNLPIEPLLNCTDFIIGVNVNNHGPMDKVEGMYNISERCAAVVIWENVKPRLAKCDISIEVEEAYPYGIFDFKSAAKIYEAGYKQTIAQIPEILEQIAIRKKKNKLFNFWK